MYFKAICMYQLLSYRLYPLLFLLLMCVVSCTSMRGLPNIGSEDQLVFFDDFSGTKLDTAKWNVEVTGMHVNNELQAYIDSSATIYVAQGNTAQGAHNGALVLQPHFAPNYLTKDGQQFHFVSGRINTNNKVMFCYGTASARIKLTKGAGLWPAWWILGAGNWPETGEIDIMESVGENDWASAAIHGPGYSGDAGLSNKYFFNKENEIDQWHIYSVDWTPDALVFKYDGKPMFKITKPMTQFFGKWAFDNQKYLILNFAVGGIYPYKTNGLKLPYYGLADSTLQAIKAGKSKMLVDWVCITQKKH